MIWLYRFLDFVFSSLYSLALSHFGYWKWLDWLQAKAFNLRFRAENRRSPKVKTLSYGRKKWRS